jgi:cyanophycinase
VVHIAQRLAVCWVKGEAAKMRVLGMRVGWRRGLVPISLVLLLSTLFPALGGAQQGQTLVPIGGGYTEASLQGFARLVIEHASGEIVQILVVPSSYGDDPADREENIELAGERTQQIEDACNAVIGEYTGFSGCEAELLILFDRNDALNPENSALFNDDETDGSYILGGDQTIAMHVLASSPAETVMNSAYARGVVFGGTSAGAAVESIDMIAGYTDPGWPYNALERDKVIIWWANDGDDERGLIFGSQSIIFDQHFYERGRFGRLLNIVAQSDEQYDGASRLGVGVDYGTGVALTNDSILSRVFGDSSMAIIDGEASGASFAWRGPNETLSARNLLTHIVAAHPEDVFSYDVARRMAVVNGQDLPFADPGEWPVELLTAPGSGSLILSGDLSLNFQGPAVYDIVTRLTAAPAGKLVIVAAGTARANETRALAKDYADAFKAALPKKYPIETIVYGDNKWSGVMTDALAGASGVVFVGGDQAQMSGPLADPTFRALVIDAVANVPVVVTDRAMTAVMGDWYVTDPDPTDVDYQDVGIEDFQIGGVTVAPGLGIIDGATFEPRVTWDQRWGRLYNLLMTHPDTIVFGISENTTLVLQRQGATVAGERSVIALDGRAGTFLQGDNGAFTALNIQMDLYAPGDAVP